MGQSDPFSIQPATRAEAEKDLESFYRPKEKVLEAWGLLEHHLDLAFRYPETEMLEMFGVCGTTISDDGLARLAQLRKVNEIDIQGAMQLRGTGFSAWVYHPNLTCITAHVSPIDDAGLAEIAKIEKLLRLSIAYTKVTDEGMKSVAKLRELRDLNLSGNNMSDAGVGIVCESLMKLESLGLEDTSVTPRVLPEIGKLKRLRRLRVGKRLLSNQFLEELAKLEQLEELSLRWAQVNVADLPALSRLKRLKWLGLTGVDLKGADLSWIKHLTALETLHLDAKNLGDEEFRTLEITGPLQVLNLVGTEISDTSIQKLGSFRLRRLGVSSQAITEASLEHIIKMRSLEELYFGGSIQDNERLRGAMPDTVIHNDVISFLASLQ